MSAAAATDKEALRQQMLLRALLGDARPGVVAGWLRTPRRGPGIERGLAAYRANAAAVAERALAAAYPTLQQLLSEESFAVLARDFWRRHPPTAGDMALWGEHLPAFVADAESLSTEPYLTDVARLEWAVHQAERAADAGPAQGLFLLAEQDPAALWLQLAPGTAVLESEHPFLTIWLAHRSQADDRFASVHAAFATQQREAALVARQGWQAVVSAISPEEARFTAALLAGRPLAQALHAAGGHFNFETWLIAALQQQRLATVATTPHQDTP